MGYNDDMLSKHDDPNRGQSEWMVAYVTHSIGEAHIIEGRLQSEGIPVMLDYMAGRGAIGLTIGSWGEIRLLVHPKDYDYVQELLFPEEPDELPDTTDDIIYHWDDDGDDSPEDEE